MIRNILGVIAGIVVAVLTVMAVQAVGHSLYPYPADIDLNDPEQIARAFPAIPFAAKAFVVAAWVAGALAGGAVAKAITGADWSAWTIAALIALGGVANIFVIPHPVWMQISAVVAPLIGGLIANHLVRGRVAARTDAGDGAI